MKTIKELEAEEQDKEGEDYWIAIGEKSALKDVVKLIDEIPQLAILDKTYPHIIDADELKQKITGAIHTS